MKSTLPTDEYALRTAVGAGRMPTAATCLRGMSRIDRDHRTTPFLGLVLDFGFETQKRPAMHAAFGLPLFGGTLALPGPLADVVKVFQHDRITRAGAGHDLLTQDVISILPKPRPSAFELSQMPFGRLGAFLLQRADLPKISSFDRFPAPLSQEVIVRCDRRSIEAQVHTYDLIGWLDFWRRNSNDDVQPPRTIFLDEISRIERMTHVFRRIVQHSKADCLPPDRRAHLHRAAVPIDTVGVDVVARWAGVRVWLADLPIDVLTRILPAHSERALNRFGCLDARLYVQIAHQGWVYSALSG